MPSLWKAEAGVPCELLELTGSVKMLAGVMRNMGQVGLITEPAAIPSSRRSRSPTREGTSAET